MDKTDLISKQVSEHHQYARQQINQTMAAFFGLATLNATFAALGLDFEPETLLGDVAFVDHIICVGLCLGDLAGAIVCLGAASHLNETYYRIATLLANLDVAIDSPPIVEWRPKWIEVIYNCMDKTILRHLRKVELKQNQPIPALPAREWCGTFATLAIVSGIAAAVWGYQLWIVFVYQ